VPLGLELDHDGQWIVSTTSQFVPWYFTSVSGVLPGGFVPITVFFPAISSSMTLGDLTIDRDPGATPYCFIKHVMLPMGASSEILATDRRGRVTSLSKSGLVCGFGIELHPRTGDYLTTLQGRPPQGWLVRVAKSGAISTLASIWGSVRRITQDDFAWIVGDQPVTPMLYKFDLSQNVVVTSFAPGGWKGPGAGGDLEVYGSRRLVCYQPPTSPTTVTLNVQSRKAGDGGKSYALACSLARRPAPPGQCLRFPNGEYLFLDYTDPLFWATALAPAPTVFQNFKGVLDSKGNATAQVNIPSTLPTNLGITVFVAGVIYDTTGVRTVTNTHWFVLP